MEPSGEEYSDWHLMGTVVGRGGEDPHVSPASWNLSIGTWKSFCSGVLVQNCTREITHETCMSGHGWALA